MATEESNPARGMRTSQPVRLALLVPSLAVLACSGDGGGQAPGAGAAPGQDGGADAAQSGDASAADALAVTDLQSYCEGIAQGMESQLQRCWGPGGFSASGRDQRLAAYRNTCLFAATGVTSGRMRFDAAAAADCVARVSAMACLANPSDFEACDRVLTGTVPVGGACYGTERQAFGLHGASNCVSGALCLGVTCPQRCQAYPAEGQPCLEHQCASAQYCDETRHCRARAAAGAPCAQGQQCVSGHVCVGATERAPGRCLVASPEGGPCGNDTAICRSPASCVAGVCKLKAAAGEPCLLPLNCPEGLSCREAAVGAGKTCQLGGRRGDACTGDLECADDHY